MAIRSPRARIRVGANAAEAYTVTMDGHDVASTNRQFPVKEWSITDDVLNICDAASVSVANNEGENTGKFSIGQRIEIDESDPDVAQGMWVRHFTGRIVRLESYSDVHGGSNILISAQDLGWHLTSSHGKPLVNLNGATWDLVLRMLIDPGWGFGETQGSNLLDRVLKQGRTGIQRSLVLQQNRLTSVLPYIQVEPGQSPWDIIYSYAQREGVLVGVTARGELKFFRPDYKQPADYVVQFHGIGDSKENNVLGRPVVVETIDELYSETQCWSTIVNPTKVQNPEDPNALYTHTVYTAPQNPLPFPRRLVFSDSEAITSTMRSNRALMKQQSGQFQSWTYEVELKGHSQGGHFFTSDTIVSVSDSIHQVSGGHYVQSVNRSATLQAGLRTKLLLRKTGLLNPQLGKFDVGAGARKNAKRTPPRS